MSNQVQDIMSSIEVTTPQASGPRAGGLSSASLLTSFVVATLISSSLLFLIQPLMAKLMLPLFGGSSSVWAVSMSFFQAMLLIGYGYAHLLRTYLSLRHGIALHLALMALGLYFLRFDAATLVDVSSGEIGTLALLAVLAKTVGFPFAVMSANAPLTQSWFSRSTHKDAEDPYFLYAASNLGSMFALLAYPFVIEPLIGLHTQTNLWTAGFLGLTLALATCGFVLISGQVRATVDAVSSQEDDAITWPRRLTWLLYAFVPSALLSAWTNHITTDVASAPFLWLPPLALYLASFVLMFRAKPLVSIPILRALLLLSLPVAYAVNYGAGSENFLIVLGSGAIAFMATTCILHRKMFEDRPGPSKLTAFYFIMSLGGVLGGAFVSLLAPVMFSSVTEYPLLLLASLLLAASHFKPEFSGSTRKTALTFAAVFLFAYLARSLLGQIVYSNPQSWTSSVMFGLWVTAFFALARSNQHFPSYVALVAVMVELIIVQFSSLGTFRNFYGVLSVGMDKDRILMLHGTTVHGGAFQEDLNLPEGQKPRPLTYYTANGGMAQSITVKQSALALSGAKGTYGVVGLGSGSLACYGNPGETWKFYEINANVTRVAQDPKYFPFMTKCGGDAPVIMGDARLTLQNEAEKSFDVLIVDAFSSDSIPVHLLTTEAMELYMRSLKDDGVMAFHISNRHLDLESVVTANVAAINTKGKELHALVHLHSTILDHDAPGASPSHVVLLSKSRAALNAHRLNASTFEAQSSDVSAWTDDYSNVISAIVRKHTNKLIAPTSPHQSE
jgi:hypothetical protein